MMAPRAWAAAAGDATIRISEIARMSRQASRPGFIVPMPSRIINELLLRFTQHATTTRRLSSIR